MKTNKKWQAGSGEFVFFFVNEGVIHLTSGIRNIERGSIIFNGSRHCDISRLDNPTLYPDATTIALFLIRMVGVEYFKENDCWLYDVEGGTIIFSDLYSFPLDCEYMKPFLLNNYEEDLKSVA